MAVVTFGIGCFTSWCVMLFFFSECCINHSLVTLNCSTHGHPPISFHSVQICCVCRSMIMMLWLLYYIYTNDENSYKDDIYAYVDYKFGQTPTRQGLEENLLLGIGDLSQFHGIMAATKNHCKCIDWLCYLHNFLSS